VAAALVALSFFASPGRSEPDTTATRGPAPLTLPDVLDSVRRQYPPMLAAMMERDIASGRLRSASGVFDLNLLAKAYGNAAGYYQSGTVDVGVEQYLGLGGSTIFGGYRLTFGERLPDYYWNRTQGGGEPRVELGVPLLRDNAIDARRAGLAKANLDRDLADPLIARQQLDFLRTATVAYVAWFAAGRRWELAERLLRVAEDRTAALERQADLGLVPRVVLTDNRRLVVAREIGVVQARRRFEATALALSLFARGDDQAPIVAERHRLPPELPQVKAPDASRLEADVQRAMDYRPELRQLDLVREKLEVDRALARNQLQPNLDARVALSQGVGEDIYFDRGELEAKAGIELKVPLQRREASGRLAELEGRITQVVTDQRFFRDRIATEVRDTFSALRAAHEQLAQTRLNAELARELQSAEEERFRRGAVDMLALQIREQAAFDAQTQAVDAVAEYFRALADYRAAIAADLLEPGTPPGRP
jgi:outer membrane protein TolC